MIKDENYTLANGVKIPKIGFGTWQIAEKDQAYNSTIWALKAGYRHIDTAYDYQNEEAIGRAIKDFGMKREDLFVTTKLPSHIKTYEGAKEYFNKSITSLGLEYIDLYLIHAPWPWSEIGKDCEKGNIEAWKAMIELHNAGKIKSIGVSNFSIDNIKNIVSATGFVPHVNQICYFIGRDQKELVKYCQDNNILVEAYSPFATGKILESVVLQNMANKYNITIPKLCLAYCLENNTLPLPKSCHESRIKDNLDVNVKISSEDMEILNNLTYDEVKPA